MGGKCSTMFLASCVFALAAAYAQAHDAYPTKPVRIVSNPAGGGSDFVARLIKSAGSTER